MRTVKFLLFLQLIGICTSTASLHVRYKWKQLDFEYPSYDERQEALQNGSFIPANNVPMGMEIWGHRMFITLIRWYTGVPSTLNYIDLRDPLKSPKLIPYPNWDAHRSVTINGEREINAPYRVRIDRCGRMWVMDNGVIGWKYQMVIYPSAILVIDLNTDKILRKYVVPDDQKPPVPGFANIVVEDDDCEDAYAYIGDFLNSAMIVYSWKNNTSWTIKHKSFESSPEALDFQVNGISDTWHYGPLGMALSDKDPDGFPTLYFYPISSFELFAVSTKYLRNEWIVDIYPNAVKNIGNKGPRSQSIGAFLDKENSVLFYSLNNQNAFGCWRTDNEVINEYNQGIIYQNNETMNMPVDIKIDHTRNIWILSNKLLISMYSQYDLNEINFRIFTAPVDDVIKNTVCEED